MRILILLVVLALFYLIVRLIYIKHWDKNLKAEIHLGRDRYIFEGEEIHVEEVLTNNKILPLPWIYVKYQLSGNNHPRIYRSDMYSILFHQRIRRKHKHILTERGVYTVSSMDLISYDLFLSKKLAKTEKNSPGQITVFPRLLPEAEWPVSYEQMQGDIITKRFFLEDPYLLKGIREYQSHDSFRDINFKASARVGKWMVNVHEYTVSQKVCILLGMDKAARYYNINEYESVLRLAGSIADVFESQGVPVELYSNGTDALRGDTIHVEAGCGAEHINAVLEALARLEIEKEKGTIASALREAVAAGEQGDTLYILMTPCYSKEIIEAYKQLTEVQESCYWILPIVQSQLNEEESPFQKMEEEIRGLTLWNREGGGQ